jgi:hypothetical protein
MVRKDHKKQKAQSEKTKKRRRKIMAKIDTAKIEGYESMTPEQKVAALEELEYEDNSSEVERLKNAATKASKEAAEWKRKHNALLDDDEQKRQAANEELENLRSQVEEMRREKAIAANKAELLAVGYDEKLAEETAEAMIDGDTAKVFSNQKKFLDSHDKSLKAAILKDTPKPPAGSGEDEMTLKKLQSMSAEERYKFYEKDPDGYKKLYGGNNE